MTREEAVTHGKEQLEVFGGKHREFIEMAIKALEQEPCEDKTIDDHYWKGFHNGIRTEKFRASKQESCEDCISREAVLENAKSYHTDGYMYTPLVVDVEDIEDLPSVTPAVCIAKITFNKDDLQKLVDEKVKEITVERKKGHWIVEDSGNYNGKYSTCYCSNCKDYFTRNWKEMKYCPNCGAEMEIK